MGEPALDGGHLLGDAVKRDATTDRAERVTVQTADGLGVSLDGRRPRPWSVDSALRVYEVGDGEPGGRLTLAPSLTRLAGR